MCVSLSLSLALFALCFCVSFFFAVADVRSSFILLTFFLFFPQMVTRTKKIFVGGLSAPSTVDDVKGYFEQFGRVRLDFLVLALPFSIVFDGRHLSPLYSPPVLPLLSLPRLSPAATATLIRSNIDETTTTTTTTTTTLLNSFIQFWLVLDRIDVAFV